MKNKPPYPTQGEIIREVAKALGTKASNKKIDDYARGGDVDGYNLRGLMIDELIYQPIKKYVSKDFAIVLCEYLVFILDDYLECMKNVGLDGLPRMMALPLLMEHFFAVKISMFLVQFLKNYKGVSPSKMLEKDKSAVALTLELIDIEHNKWGKGELPQLLSIANLDVNENEKCLLLISRAMDFFKIQKIINGSVKVKYNQDKIKSNLSDTAFEAVKNFLTFTESQYRTGDYLTDALEEYHNENFVNFLPSASQVYAFLLSEENRSLDLKLKTRKRIDDLNVIAQKEDPDNLCSYIIDWFEAMWHLFSGDINKANSYYKNAFHNSLYSAGENQIEILRESLIVAARLKDKPFLKRLKNQGIVFGLFGPPNSEKDVVQEWEVKEWTAGFNQDFPQSYLYEGVTYDEVEDNSPLIVIEDSLPKPDYRNPDRVFNKLFDGKQRSYPQLIWFILRNEYKFVKKLLLKGARVDIPSKSGETAILLAIQHLSVLDNDHGIDGSLYKLISKIEHKPETLNIRTVKKKLLPIISAVNTGEPNIVSKIIQMGADVEGRGMMDDRTALYHCLVIIRDIKDPNQSFMNLHNLTTNDLESVRRHTNGYTGITLNDQKAAMEKSLNDPSFRAVMVVLQEFENKKILKFDINKMREIASILVEAGADVNAEHSTSSVLALATEIGEEGVLEKI